MIQLYVDDILVYDSRVSETALLGLTAQLGLNKGGAATIILPPTHPAYNDFNDDDNGGFNSYRSVVTIYRNGKLRFRGRILYPSDDFNLTRTIICEGERCFLRDGIHRPGVTYNDSPANIFTTVIGLYNAQVEAFKQFVVGTIEGISTEAVVLEIEEAETFSSILDRLIELCGGQIVFTTNHDGRRVINWYASIGYNNQQTIEFGENLVDFSRTAANTDLATVIYPYGAKDESTGERLTIASVNGGLDFIKDDAAVALRGVIARAVYWDEIVTPDALLEKAQQYLNDSKNIVSSLGLTAIDLSLLDKSIDSFVLGDIIKVRSKPHGVDGTYQLTEQDIDFLHPQNDRIILGKNIASLTGSDVASARKNDDTIRRINRAIRADYNVNTDAIIETAKMELSTLIQQTSEALKLEVAEQYTTQDEVKQAITTTMTQLSDSFEFLFTELRTHVDANDADAREQLLEIKKYVRIEDGNIILGEAGNEITLRLENGKILFLDDGAEVAYFTDKHLTVKDASFLNSMRIGSFAFIPRDNGNLSLVKVGE